MSVTSTNSCLQYFVHTNVKGEPIPSTMYAAQKAHGQATCKRLIVPVPPYQIAITKECRPKSGLRYFYKVKKDTRTGAMKVVPNSMFSGTHRPKSMCSGTESILEFIVTAHS